MMSLRATWLSKYSKRKPCKPRTMMMMSLRAKSAASATLRTTTTNSTRQRVVPASNASAITPCTYYSSDRPSSSQIRRHSEHHRRHHLSGTPRRSLSTAAATAVESPNGESARPEQPSKSSKSRNVYMWGTSKKGTIPMNILLDPTGSLAAGGGGIFSGDDKVIDHPMKLNLEGDAWNSFLNVGKDDGDDDVVNNAVLKKVFCGASGTAMVLEDGRCFVLGTNKNGELG
mmetsp:Transcript_13411/g.28110  ORF Transcript_13411/g.28110 Transcript_13411/m.28110 type:complete len:229 (-) Transcript_13411:1268-1954(-)